MIVRPSTDASRHHNCCIDGGTSPEYFGYTLVGVSLFYDEESEDCAWISPSLFITHGRHETGKSVSGSSNVDLNQRANSTMTNYLAERDVTVRTYSCKGGDVRFYTHPQNTLNLALFHRYKPIAQGN
jgi:hypothetical protein